MSIAAMIGGFSEEEARAALMRCCGSTRWVEEMLAARPFEADEAMFETADRLWFRLGPDDWREAFSHHPRIGERDLGRLTDTQGREWSRKEQSGMDQATDVVRDTIVALNERYEERFGHVFLICASGLSAEELQSAFLERIDHEPLDELRVAATEQSKITRLRLVKLGDA